MKTVDECISIIERMSREQVRTEIVKGFCFTDIDFNFPHSKKTVSVDEYSMKMFEYAYIYLSTIYPENEFIIDELVHDKLFWAWWRIQYYKVDCYLILKLNTDAEFASLTKKELHKLYYLEHAFVNVFPDKVVIENLNKVSKQSKTQPHG